MHLPENDSITYLVGGMTISKRSRPPYDSLYCDFLNDVSAELRLQKGPATFSDVMSFAYWCRKANIHKLKTDFENGKSRLGLGLVFHVTPSNVPVNFAFSYAFGLLSGNSNIVRIPSKPFPQIDLISSTINKLLEEEKYTEIRDTTAFVRYEQNDKITGKFSEACNARIIWGGDEAIRNIRKSPIPEQSVEVVFSDRSSLCAINASSVNSLDEKRLRRLAENFYNDTYLMDQNACSSPHLIVWLGKNKEVAKERFWMAISNIVEEKYQLEDIHAMDKYCMLCRDAIEIDEIKSVIRENSNLYRVILDDIPSIMDQLRGKFGYFYEYDTEAIENLKHIVTNKYQTLTYFGIEKKRLLKFVYNNRLPGINRIVPIGNALDMSIIWDGYDIVGSLSRIIDVK